jgi:hypothetical protein
MKTTIVFVSALFCAALIGAADKQVSTFTISAQDVIQSSIYKFKFQPRTNTFTIKFQYTEAGSNRARAFTEAHQNQMVRDKIGAFETPPAVLRSTNTSGRNGLWGISEKDANAIIEGLKKRWCGRY